jgi:hypothetical protein
VTRGQARHGLSAAQYQAEFDALTAQGYGSIRISAYDVKGRPQFAAIWDKSGSRWEARHNLRPDEYQVTFDDLVAQGYQLLDVSVHGGSLRYAAISTRTSPGGGRPATD